MAYYEIRSPYSIIKEKDLRPNGYGWITDPEKAAYNLVYNRTTFGIEDFVRKSGLAIWKIL